jgi:hypothetical protein
VSIRHTAMASAVPRLTLRYRAMLEYATRRSTLIGYNSRRLLQRRQPFQDIASSLFRTPARYLEVPVTAYVHPRHRLLPRLLPQAHRLRRLPQTHRLRRLHRPARRRPARRQARHPARLRPMCRLPASRLSSHQGRLLHLRHHPRPRRRPRRRRARHPRHRSGRAILISRVSSYRSRRARRRSSSAARSPPTLAASMAPSYQATG